MALLDALADAIDKLPFKYLLAGHCLAVASWLTHLQSHFMNSYWIGFLAAFGGGTVTALVIGDRKVAPLAILSSNEIAVFWSVSWWLLNYSPLSSFLLGLLEGFLPLKVASKACVNTLRAQLISARVDFAVGAFPGVVAAPLLLGTLAGGAGKMTTDPLLAAAGHPPSPAAEFSSPGFSLRSAALGALWQAVAAHWLAFLTPRQAGAALAAVLVLHGAAVDVHSWWLGGRGRGSHGRSFDFTAGPARLLHAVSRVPAPPSVGESSARGGGGREEEKKKKTPAVATTTTRTRSAARKKSA